MMDSTFISKLQPCSLVKQSRAPLRQAAALTANLTYFRAYHVSHTHGIRKTPEGLAGPELLYADTIKGGS